MVNETREYTFTYYELQVIRTALTSYIKRLDGVISQDLIPPESGFMGGAYNNARAEAERLRGYVDDAINR